MLESIIVVSIVIILAISVPLTIVVAIVVIAICIKSPEHWNWQEPQQCHKILPLSCALALMATYITYKIITGAAIELSSFQAYKSIALIILLPQ